MEKALSVVPDLLEKWKKMVSHFPRRKKRHSVFIFFSWILSNMYGFYIILA